MNKKIVHRRWVVPLQDFTEANPRLASFRKLKSVGANVPGPIYVVTHDAFEPFKQNPDKFASDLREFIDDPFTDALNASLWGNLALRRAYVVPGLEQPQGPRFLGIRELDGLIEGVRELFQYAIDNGLDREHARIVCFFYPFVDPPPLDDPSRLAYHSLPHGGYAIPLSDDGRIVQVLATWGNNETLGDYEGDGKQIETYVVEVDSQWNKTRVRSKVIPQKLFMKATTVRSGLAGSERLTVPLEYQMVQILGEPEILEVARVVVQLAESHGPQRVEFSSDGKELFFNEVADWRQEKTALSQELDVTSTVFVYHKIAQIARLEAIVKNGSESPIVYIDPWVVSDRERYIDYLYPLANRLRAAQLVVLVPRGGRTSHAMTVFREAGHFPIPIGPQRFRWLRGDTVHVVSMGGDIQAENLSVTAVREATPLILTQALGVQLVGAKALRLSLMMGKGYNVVRGLVLTTVFFDRLLELLGLSELHKQLAFVKSKSEVRSVLAQLRSGLSRMPESLWEIVLGMMNRIEGLRLDRPLVVRSSANVEDVHGSSFAGVFESFLDVTGREDIKQAIIECVKSVFQERVLDYVSSQEDAGRMSNIKMAVLIQSMVSPRIAGTLFGAEPDNKDTGIIMIEASEGRSDDVVSGSRVDDQVYVSKLAHSIVRREGRSIIRDGEISALVELNHVLEEMFECPQDIEWAIDKQSELWVLQSRDLDIG